MRVSEIDQGDFAAGIRRDVEGLVVRVGEGDVRFEVCLGKDESTRIIRVGFCRAADL